MSAQPKRVEFFCETCGSTDIGSDACAHWNVGAQRWEFTDTYDNTWCSDCGSEGIGEREAPAPQAPAELERDSEGRTAQDRYDDDCIEQYGRVELDTGLNY